MKRFIASSLAVLLLVIVFVSSAAGVTFNKNKENPSIPKGKVFNEDLYLRGQDVTFSGKVNGDLVVMGSNIVINGEVSRNLIVMGSNIVITGNVAQDIFAMGSKINIQGNVTHDVFAMAGKCSVSGHVKGDVVNISSETEITEGGKIGKDMVVAGGRAEINGIVGRNVMFKGNNVKILGKVGRTALLETGIVKVDSSASIGKNLIYHSQNKAKIEKGAVIKGNTVFKHQKTSILGWFLLRIWFLLSMIILGLVLAYVFPETMALPTKTASGDIFKYLGVGIAVMIVIPTISAVLMFTGIGVPLAIAVLALYLFGLLVSPIVSAIYLGQVTLKATSGKEPSVIWALITGLLLITLVSVLTLVPFAGAPIVCIFYFFGVAAGVGGITVSIKKSYKKVEEGIAEISGQS